MNQDRLIIATPVGDFEIVFERERVLSFGWACSGGVPVGSTRPTGQAGRLADALENYFRSGEWDFSWFELPAPNRPVSGNTLLVYDYLRKSVGPGSVITYRELGRITGFHPRAIGSMMRCNPWPIVVPCHRVIGSDGSLVGYAGGLDKKAWLLKLEGWSAGRE